MPHLPELIDFADNCGAGIMLMYQLVAVGRGEKIEKATLKKTANKYLSELIALKQKSAHTMIEPVAGPQYWPYILEKNGICDGLMLKIAGKVFHGCAAGRVLFTSKPMAMSGHVPLWKSAPVMLRKWILIRFIMNRPFSGIYETGKNF